MWFFPWLDYICNIFRLIQFRHHQAILMEIKSVFAFFQKKNAWWCQNCIRRIILQIESNQGKKSQWKRAKHQNYLCVFDSTPAFSLFSVFKLQYWLKLLKRLFYVRSHPLVAVCRWVSVGVTFFKLWTQILKLSEFLFCLFLIDP